MLQIFFAAYVINTKSRFHLNEDVDRVMRS